MTVPICKRVCFLQGRPNSRANDDVGIILPTGAPSANSRSEFSRSRTQPRGPDHPSGWLLGLLCPEFGKVQTEPTFQEHVRIENGNKFRSSQLCRPQVARVVSIGAVFLVGE